MKIEHRLAIASVRVAALRGLLAAGGEPSPAQLARAGRPLLEDPRSRPPAQILGGGCAPGPRSLAMLAGGDGRRGLVDRVV